MATQNNESGSLAPLQGKQPQVLNRRALNRALLSRQMLLERANIPVLEAVEHLVGMQAQAPNAPYVGLWSRLAHFEHSDLSTLLLDRKAVRIVLMRGTIHLVSARDCLVVRPSVQSVLDRWLHGALVKRLGGVDLQELASAGRVYVEKEALTYHELGIRLQERWPDNEPEVLANAVRALVPLVQVPPRGIWGASGQAAHTSAEAWLGKPLEAESRLEELMLRYLAAFGPASVKDMQVWSGLTGLNQVVERLRPHLRSFLDEEGHVLWDRTDGAFPDEDTAVPIRFLGEFDNMLLSYHNRTRIMADADKPSVFTRNGIIRATVLIDGFVSGIWSIEERRGTASLQIKLFKSVSAAEEDALHVEGSKLLQFAAMDAEDHEIRVVSAIHS